MILIDSNIPMYLVGREHPLKIDAQRLVEKLVVAKRRLVTDTEVFQEILHRYVAINRRDAIQPAFDVLQKLVDEIIPVEFSDIEGAKNIVFGHQRLSARDAVHLAVMERQGISDVATFDRGFDDYPGVRRWG